MPKILCIDTSTDTCSVILGSEEGVLYERVSLGERDHSAKAGMFVDEILQQAKADGIAAVDAVAVCSGPGSYTGLRIGVSLAKGVCYGYGIPLIAVDSLKLMAHHVVATKELPTDAVLCPMIDARRMEVYASLWSTELDSVREPAADIVDEETYAAYTDKPFYYFGTGADKCQEMLAGANAVLVDGVTPMADMLLAPALAAFANGTFEDVAYFEPFYLKQFQTTVSKKNVLGL